MTRSEYRAARRLIRDNGRYAFRWLENPVRGDMEALADIQNAKDELAERADIIAYCKRTGAYCDIRHTGPVRYL